MSLRDDLEILAHELECDPTYNFRGLSTSDGDKFADKLARLRKALSGAAVDVLEERQRQIEKEGWTPEHDDQHSNGELAEAAACYAFASADPEGSNVSYDDLSVYWPWGPQWWKPTTDRRRMLVKAGALIQAEIERRDRAAQRDEEDYHGGDFETVQP